MKSNLNNILDGNQIISSKKESDTSLYLVRMINGPYAVLVVKDDKLVYSQSFIQESDKRAALKKAKKCFQEFKKGVYTIVDD